MRRVVVISDIQAPLHDKKMVEAVTLAVKGMKLGPDDLVAVVGDECDSTSIGRWVRGRAQEYTDNLQVALDTTHDIIKGFREAAPRTPVIVQRSNHTTDRIQNYVNKHAPALAPLRGLDWASLMRYDEIDVQLRLWPTPIAPGWLMAHGDELSGSSRIAGGLAMGLSRRFGKSVVCGHSHKAGIQHDHDSHSGKITRYLFGMEVGSLMSLPKAQYLKSGGANWTHGFGVLYQHGNHVTPNLVPIVNRGFTLEGKHHSW